MDHSRPALSELAAWQALVVIGGLVPWHPAPPTNLDGSPARSKPRLEAAHLERARRTLARLEPMCR